MNICFIDLVLTSKINTVYCSLMTTQRYKFKLIKNPFIDHTVITNLKLNKLLEKY